MTTSEFSSDNASQITQPQLESIIENLRESL